MAEYSKRKPAAIVVRFTITCNPILTQQEHGVFLTSYITSDVPSKPELIMIGSKELEENNMEATVEFSFDSSIELLDDTSLCVQMFCHLENHKGEKCAHRCGFAAFALRGMANAIERNSNASPPKFYELARDHGIGRNGRGQIMVIPDRTVTMLKFGKREENVDTIVSKASSRMLYSWIHEMRTYHNAYANVIPDGGTVDPGIRVKVLPMYILSGGMLLPSCAFLLARSPPKATEEYYLNALHVVMERRYPWVDISNGKRMADALNRCNVNEQGSLLMEVALVLPTSCPYLFDTAISGSEDMGFQLRNTDEFSRICRLVKCGDCEDGSLEATMVLWDILVAGSSTSPVAGKWVSEVMMMLKQIRMRYVVMVTLKAVTRPSQSSSSSTPETDSNNKKNKESCECHKNHANQNAGMVSYAAHACCDMVPLWWMATLLSASGKMGSKNSLELQALTEISKERWREEEKSSSSYGLVTNARPSQVIVGEATGIVTPVVDQNNTAPKWARKAARDMFGVAIPGVKVICREDMTVGSTFYRYTMSGLMHDTLISPAAKALAKTHGVEWICPQIVYTSENNTKSGIAHTAYVSCSTALTAANPVRPPTLSEWKTMISLEKFEHPIPRIACAAANSGGGEKSGQLAVMELRSLLSENARSKEIVAWESSPIIHDMFQFTRDRSKKYSSGGDGDQDTEWTMMLSVSSGDMNAEAAEILSSELEGENVKWFAMRDASICNGVNGCTLFVRIIKR